MTNCVVIQTSARPNHGAARPRLSSRRPAPSGLPTPAPFRSCRKAQQRKQDARKMLRSCSALLLLTATAAFRPAAEKRAFSDLDADNDGQLDDVEIDAHLELTFEVRHRPLAQHPRARARNRVHARLTRSPPAVVWCSEKRRRSWSFSTAMATGRSRRSSTSRSRARSSRPTRGPRAGSGTQSTATRTGPPAFLPPVQVPLLLCPRAPTPPLSCASPPPPPALEQKPPRPDGRHN